MTIPSQQHPPLTPVKVPLLGTVHLVNGDPRGSPDYSPRTHMYIPLRHLTRLIYGFGGLVIALGVYGISTVATVLPGVFWVIGSLMILSTVATVAWCGRVASRWSQLSSPGTGKSSFKDFDTSSWEHE